MIVKVEATVEKRFEEEERKEMHTERR